MNHRPLVATAAGRLGRFAACMVLAVAAGAAGAAVAAGAMPRSGATVLPISVEAGEIVVNATIDGRGPFALMFDTGAHSSLTPEAASALGLKAEAAGTILDSGGRTVAAQLTHVGKLQLGSAEMTDQPFMVVALPPYVTDRGSRPALAGLLGIELLQRYAVRVDYSAGTLTLSPAAEFRSGDGVRLPLIGAQDLVEVQAAADDIAGRFVLDTGSTGALTLSRDFVEAHAIETRHPSSLRIKSIGIDGPFKALLTRLDRFDIAESRVEAPATRLPTGSQTGRGTADFDGIIGYEILRQFVVTFDCRHRQVWLERSAAFGSRTGRGSAGFQAVKVGGAGFRIITVLPGTAAASAGLREGDLITAVDGTPVTSMSLGEFAQLMARPQGTRLWLRLARAGAAEQVALTLRDILPAGSHPPLVYARAFDAPEKR